jgi:hypothetical protein
LQRRLAEVGRIRTGDKTERGAPRKLDRFRLTSKDPARLQAAADTFGGTVRPWRDGEHELYTDANEIPILLLPGQSLSQWYELWAGSGVQRRCDGVHDVLSDGPCRCTNETGDRKCKPTTRLSVMLPDVPGLGTWRLESHGYYAAVELSAAAALLEAATAQGQILPARLRLEQRLKVEGGKTTRYAVPVLDIDVRVPEVLALGRSTPADVAPAHTPVPALPGVSVDDALEATGRQAAPASRTARSAAEIGPAIVETAGPASEPPVEMNTTTVAVPGDAATLSPAADTAPSVTQQQARKLNVLVGKLRDAGHLTTDQLYAALARERRVDVDTMIGVLDGARDERGGLHWGPLRDSLTKTEASTLIERLTVLEGRVSA